MPRSQSPLTLEYILLGILNENPGHGYDLYKRITAAEGISLIWKIKQSQMYALLSKLEELKLVVSSEVPGEAHPMRREYHLTGVGRETFHSWMTSPVANGRDVRQEFLARLYFAQKADREVAQELIDNQRETCFEWLESLRISFEQLDEERHYEKMVYQYRIWNTEAILTWLDYCERELR